MHIQNTRVRSGSSYRRYTRLVQSYRRPDGMPAQKVIANLGELSDQEVANLRVALAASRQGQTVVLPTRTAEPLKTRILANLDYLSFAVMHQLWRGWKLSELLRRLIDDRSAHVAPSEIVCALTLLRCVSPGSKLSAQRAFPRTALPELLEIDPDHFNNSRLHRVLDQLDRVDAELQESLPKRYEHRDGTFAALFADVTDTWFQGRGCDLAERGHTKEGLRNRYKVGILLLCNERGYPVRWKVLSGRTRDPQVLTGLVGEIETLDWVKEVPIVFDRAMGNASSVARLVESGLCFLTATRRSEIASYTQALPTAVLSDLEVTSDEEEQLRVEAEAARRVGEAGMEKLSERLYVLDLGLCERKLSLLRDKSVGDTSCIAPESLEGGAVWLWRARDYQKQLDEKLFSSRARLAASLGVSRARMTQIMNLLRLDQSLQEDVLAGCFGFIPDRQLRNFAALKGKVVQQRALSEHALTARPMAGSDKPERPRRIGKIDATFRLVAYFNPQMFVDQRSTAQRHLTEIEDHVADLNRRLRRESCRRSRESVQVEITNKLASRALLSVYKVELCEPPQAEDGLLQVKLTLDQDAWRKRRRFDGFVLLVAHPEMSGTAGDVVQLYRAKDAVEKDFQTIKTDLNLRPVFHHTDPKVRAHITLCMLALLLERTLEDRLRRSKHPMTAPACLEELASVRLNMLRTEPDLDHSYVITEANKRQTAILRSLRMTQLLEPEQIAEQLHPRPPP